MSKGKVCVTGAGGYVASHLVKLLLSKGYIVHGTIRDPSNAKYAHLMKLEKAEENLKLFQADLLDYDTVHAAISGCNGVFHVASPVPSSSVPNPEVELMEPAVKGTMNVLNACSDAKVKRTVYVSSVAAVAMNPNWPKGRVMDESCWSDREYCKQTNNWYCASKTEAEFLAFAYAKANGLDVVSVCPTLVFGPILQPSANASTLVLVKLLKDGSESVENKNRRIVDVRDLTEALLLTYENPEAEGRYICTSHAIRSSELVDKLKSMYPRYEYPKSFTEVDEDIVGGGYVSSERLQKLGWRFRPLEETLVDSVESYREAGLIT